MAELLQVRRCEKRNRKHFCWVMLLMYTAWKYWDIRKDLKQFSTYYNSKFDYIYIYIYMKTKYAIFLQWNTKFVIPKVLFLLHFGLCQNCMSSANIVAEIHQKLCNKRALSTREPWTCEYVTLLQSFHRGTLSIHWYIAQHFWPTFSMSVLFRRLFKTAIFDRFSKVAIAT